MTTPTVWTPGTGSTPGAVSSPSPIPLNGWPSPVKGLRQSRRRRWQYTEAGLPWFEWYGGDVAAIDGAKKLKKLASVAQLGKKKGEQPLPENESVDVTQVVGLSAGGATLDREFTSDEILRS